jgi:primary-amine oxidase
MRRLHLAIAVLLGLAAVSAACSAAGTEGTPPSLVTGSGATAAAGSLTGAGSAVAAEIRCGEREVGLSRRLSSGATWALCLQVDAKRGMVLREVTLTPPGGHAMLVAHDISLAQLEVPYDTGARLTEDITSAGFGGIKMQDLGTQECAGELVGVPVPTIGDGSTFGDIPTRKVLCSEVTDAGLAYRSAENGQVVAARKNQWTLATVSKVGWYEYVTRYTFGADGTISPDLGATGDLSPVDWTSAAEKGSAVGKGDDEHAASHAHNAVWRIHWALGKGPLAVQQYDASPTGADGKQAPLVDGGLRHLGRATTADRASRRWWRVVSPSARNADGHPISYEIDLGASDSFELTEDRAHGARHGYDIAFTNYDACEVFATGNDQACGDGVPDYVAADTAPLTDVVSWVAVGFHHVPRDEDQSPMELHWQGFRLVPRDLTATRFDVPASRTGRNGQPKTYEGVPIDELTDLPSS